MTYRTHHQISQELNAVITKTIQVLNLSPRQERELWALDLMTFSEVLQIISQLQIDLNETTVKDHLKLLLAAKCDPRKVAFCAILKIVRTQ